MAVSDLLNTSVAIQSRATTQDAIGGITAGDYTTRATAACAIWPASSKTVNDFARQDLVAQYEIATAVDVSGSAGDRAVVDGRTYNVIGYMRFENPIFGGSPLYLTVCGQRNQ